MTNTRDILNEATRRKIRLTPNGESLRYEYPNANPPDAAFVDILRVNKMPLLKLLAGKRNTARQILSEGKAEWGGANDQQLQAVIESLRENYFDPVCRAAIERLENQSRLPTNHR
jgi:hypothetical protein